MPLTPLRHRSLIALSGPDAEHLLEGLVTARLPGESDVVGSALLTPQGKILFTFLLSRTPEGFRLECDATERDALIKRLTLYKLRANVTIEPEAMGAFSTDWETEAPGALRDLRFSNVAGSREARTYGHSSAQDDGAALARYTARRVAAGVLEGPQEIASGQDFPHDVALDLTEAVAFNKGCFVGQEVVSRVKHRGTARRRPVILTGESIGAGEPVLCGEREIGVTRSATARQAIAVVRLDHIRGPLSVAGRAVSVSVPPYATYGLEVEITLQGG
ncbi:MAG: folate-binding protein [Pseudomonadota bacterium]